MIAKVEIDISKAFDSLDFEERCEFLRRKAERNNAVIVFEGDEDIDNEDSSSIPKSDIDFTINEMKDKFKQEGEESAYSGAEIMLMLDKLNAQLGNRPKGVTQSSLWEYGKYSPKKL